LGGRKEAINMIEVESKQVSEDLVADAVAAAHKAVGEICELISELQEKVGVEKEIIIREIDAELTEKITAQVSGKLYELKQIADKKQRNSAVKALFDEVIEQYCKSEEPEAKNYGVSMVKTILDDIQGETVKKLLLEGIRLDGRAFDEVRQIECEVGILPRSHGSALFTRGQTQALVTVTLGTARDSQIVDGLVEEYSDNFMLHYNFPPFSVGEVRPVRGPGRREIGHGALAQKALKQMQPTVTDFPYTIKINSDITESNGSSSMASVCGGCLAMMDAGVPIAKPVAGISIGMISDKNGYKLLTDIVGEEDHYGEMDFKVAGTVDGITAIQLDIKAEGLAHDAMVDALAQAKKTRIKILDIMTAVIDKPKANLSVYAPKVTSIKIDPELIGKVIGPGGKMIKGIQEKTGAVIEIEEDGTISISCVGGDGYLQARDIIEAMTTPPKVGKIYKDSKVVSVKDFGIFVEIAPGLEGLCHVSELSNTFVKNIEDVCKAGDLVDVKLILIDDQGTLKLSRKAVLVEAEKAKKSNTNKEAEKGDENKENG